MFSVEYLWKNEENKKVAMKIILQIKKEVHVDEKRWAKYNIGNSTHHANQWTHHQITDTQFALHISF